MENKHNNIKDAVLARINTGEISMRPHVYFTLRLCALACVALLVLAVSIVIFNFILFSVHASGRENLLMFGPRGFASFIQFFPWWLLLIDALLVAGLQYLVRTFQFGYRIPLLYMLAGLLVLTVGLGLFVDKVTPLNDLLEVQAHGGHLPPGVGNFFDHARRPPRPEEGVCRCTVVSIAGNTIVAEDHNFGTTTLVTIVLPPNEAQATTSGLRVGDNIFVVGDEDGGVIHAFGVRRDDIGNKR
ncbi:MAG: hypothetical protein JWO43_129 [Candidatus Adlerbacteria bacterium]|nr:hypothetical protein [Candidatus Adlerbacteria bacterium]